MAKTKEPTVLELVTKAQELGLSESESRTVIKAEKIRSFPKLERIVTEMIKQRQVQTRKFSSKSGFRFGPVWLASVKNGKGIAAKPQNFPKLIETARLQNIEIPSNIDQIQLLGLLSSQTI